MGFASRHGALCLSSATWSLAIWAVSVVATVATFGGCSVYDESSLRPSAVHVPEPPDVKTSSALDSESQIIAVHDISMFPSFELARRIGVDLDSSVRTGQDSCGDKLVSEAIGGIDNSITLSLLTSIQPFLACLEDNIAITHGTGRGTLLIQMSDWNGTANDAHVTGALALSVDGTSHTVSDTEAEVLWSGEQANQVLLSGAAADAPAWLGSDTFFLDPAFNVASIESPSHFTPRSEARIDGWVVNNTLVAPLPSGYLVPLIEWYGAFDLFLTDAALVARLNGAAGFEAAMLVGRVDVGALIQAGYDLGLCNTRLTEDFATSAADVRAQPRLDRTEGDCESLSLGIGLRGKPARVARHFAPTSAYRGDPCNGATEGLISDFCCPSGVASLQLNYNPAAGSRDPATACDAVAGGPPNSTAKRSAIKAFPAALSLPVGQHAFFCGGDHNCCVDACGEEFCASSNWVDAITCPTIFPEPPPPGMFD